MSQESTKKQKDDCRIDELIQYHCVKKTDHVACQPIERFFRRCRGRPAVEVTKVIELTADGKPTLPADLWDAMPPLKAKDPQ